MSVRRPTPYIIDVPEPPNLIDVRRLTGDEFIEANKHNAQAREDWRRLHALKLISGREVPRCEHPMMVPTAGPDDQVCGITYPFHLSIDHIHNDGQDDRKKYSSQKAFITGILTGKVAYKGRLQVLCHNHNIEKAILRMRAGEDKRGRPQRITDEQIRQTSGLSLVEAGKVLGCTRQTVAHRRRRILLDTPQESMVD